MFATHNSDNKLHGVYVASVNSINSEEFCPRITLHQLYIVECTPIKAEMLNRIALVLIVVTIALVVTVDASKYIAHINTDMYILNF